jgi:hypothetical protein
LPAYVVVQLAGPSARSRGKELLARPKVEKLLTEHDAVVLPAPQIAGDQPGNPPTMTIAVPDMARANTLAAALRGMDGIETAYAKPGEELP